MIAELARDGEIEKIVFEAFGVRDQELPEVAYALPRGPRHTRSYGSSQHRHGPESQHEGHGLLYTRRRADQDQPRDALRVVDGTRDGPQSAHGVTHDSRFGYLQSVQYLLDESSTEGKQIQAAVIEWVGKAVARTVDREHPIFIRQYWKQRSPLESFTRSSVDEEHWGPTPSFDDLRGASRPSHSRNSVTGDLSAKIRGLHCLQCMDLFGRFCCFHESLLRVEQIARGLRRNRVGPLLLS